MNRERQVLGTRITRSGLSGWRRLHREQGQSLVEIGLSLPVVLLTMVGLIEIGRVAYASIEVSSAARAGVQYGAQSEYTATDSSGMQQAAMNDVNLSGLTASASYSCKCSDGSATNCIPNTCTTGTHLEEYVTVTTGYAMQSIFNYPGIPHSYSLSGAATMRVRR